jgi:hypothetical protein
MNDEAKQEQAYWAYQAKMENRQRMIDKGWGDRDAYNKLREEEIKRARIRKYKKIASDVGIALMLFVFIFGLLFLAGCSSTSGTAYNQAPSQQLVIDKQVASLTRNEVIHGVTECEGAGLRAHVITTKRSINGFTADIPVEVTCMPKHKW